MSDLVELLRQDFRADYPDDREVAHHYRLERHQAADEIERLRESLEWAVKNLGALVTEDEGSGAFVRRLEAPAELAGFGEGMEKARSLLPIGYNLSDEDWKHIARTRLMNDPEERRAADEEYEKSKSSVNDAHVCDGSKT